MKNFFNYLTPKEIPTFGVVAKSINSSTCCSWFTLTQSGFTKKFTDMGISKKEVNKIIDRIENRLDTKFSYKERLLRENAFDLVSMIVTH